MKSNLYEQSWFAFVFFLLSLSTHGQGTFVYDQQSGNESIGAEGDAGIQANQPIGQSFTPTLSSVGFIHLFLADSIFNNLGATVYVNLRSDSITGTILGSTDPVLMLDRFFGYPDFLFSTPVAVTPGVTYYFQPIVQSGDAWSIGGAPPPDYPGGTAFFRGVPDPRSDVWFREGIVVPEPSSGLLVLLGAGVFGCVRLFRQPLSRSCD